MLVAPHPVARSPNRPILAAYIAAVAAYTAATAATNGETVTACRALLLAAPSAAAVATGGGLVVFVFHC